jgi:hypothetical protein
MLSCMKLGQKRGGARHAGRLSGEQTCCSRSHVASARATSASRSSKPSRSWSSSSDSARRPNWFRCNFRMMRRSRSISACACASSVRSAMQFSRLSIHSQRISSRTSALLRDGWAAKSKVSKLLVCGKRASLIRRLHVAAFAINALEFTKTQQKARVIGPVLRRFLGNLFILACESRKLQGLEMIKGSAAQRGLLPRALPAYSCLCPRRRRNEGRRGNERKIGARIGCPNRRGWQIRIKGQIKPCRPVF